MNSVESEGKTIEEATQRALLLLGIEADDAEITILQDPNEGDPGSGAAMARVRVEPASQAESTGKDGDIAVSEAPTDVPKTQTKSDTFVEVEKNVSGETSEDELGDEGDDEVDDEELGGEAAVECLEDLLDAMDLDCEIGVRLQTDEGKAVIEISGEDTGLAIGRQGQTLDAIEFIVNRMIEKRDPEARRVVVDAEGYRARRLEKLREMALDHATEAREQRQSVMMEPMSPRDRRTIHITLRDEGGVTTHSEGEGRFRHVVIEPVRDA